MKRVVLHIGTPKTGSTALQLFMSDNRDSLAKAGIGYYKQLYDYNPWCGPSNASFLWAEALTKLGEPSDKIKREWLRSNDSLNICYLSLNETKKSNLIKEKENFISYAKDYDTIILSEEVLWHYTVFYEDYWTIIKDYLMECCGADTEIEVLTYYRRQDRWILSKWKEDMRNEIPDPWSFDKTLAEYERIGYLDYYSIQREIEDVFGKDSIKVRSAERRGLYGGSIIDDFIKTSDLRVDMNSLKNTKKYSSTNQSLIPATAHAMSLLNRSPLRKTGIRHYTAANIHSRYLKRTIPKMSEYKQVQTKEERKDLIKRFEKSNRALSERYCGGTPLFDNEIDNGKCMKANYARDLLNASIIQLMYYAGKIKR